MRAVIGTVTSSKPISLTKAASILSRFSAAGAGAPRDVAAYLHRASAAFEDLVGFHRQLREEHRGVDAGGEEEEVKKTKKIETPVPTRGIEANGAVEKKKKKMNSEREQKVVENGGDGDGKKKKKKRKHSSVEERGDEDGSEVRERKKKSKKNVAGN